jgi:hypothetical protein
MIPDRHADAEPDNRRERESQHGGCKRERRRHHAEAGDP